VRYELPSKQRIESYNVMNILHILIGGTIGGIEILCKDFYLFSNTNYLCFIKKEGDIYSSLCSDTKRVIGLFQTGKLDFIKLNSAISKINLFCSQNNIHRVFIHHDGIFMWNLGLKLCQNGYEVILYAHSNYADLVRNRLNIPSLFKKYLFSKVASKVTCIYAISKSVKESIIKHVPRLNKDKIFVNYNGIDVSKFIPKRFDNWHSPLRFVYIGRLTKNKGVQNIISLLAKVESFEFSLDIIGEGPYEPALRKKARKGNIGDKVHFLGKTNDVPSALAKEDVFIHLPNWEEGFGISVIEAMAAGLICITNSRGALKEIVCNNVNGYILATNSYPENIAILNKIYCKFCAKEVQEISNSSLKTAGQFSISQTALCLERSFQ
jgi:glycosyltransferase involved in cell wall biosynthesis